MTPQTRKFRIESTLDLQPDCEVAVEASGYAVVESDTFGEDADGRRGETRTNISEVTVVCLWAFFPGRPAVCLAQKPIQVQQFLRKEELKLLEELGCEKIFLEDGRE